MDGNAPRALLPAGVVAATTFSHLPSHIVEHVVKHLAPREVDACLATASCFRVLTKRTTSMQAAWRVAFGVGGRCPCGSAKRQCASVGDVDGSHTQRHPMADETIIGERERMGCGAACFPVAVRIAAAAGELDILRALCSRARYLWIGQRSCCSLRQRRANACARCSSFWRYMFLGPSWIRTSSEKKSAKKQLNDDDDCDNDNSDVGSGAFEAALVSGDVRVVAWIMRVAGSNMTTITNPCLLMSPDPASAQAELVRIYQEYPRALFLRFVRAIELSDSCSDVATCAAILCAVDQDCANRVAVLLVRHLCNGLQPSLPAARFELMWGLLGDTLGAQRLVRDFVTAASRAGAADLLERMGPVVDAAFSDPTTSGPISSAAWDRPPPVGRKCQHIRDSAYVALAMRARTDAEAKKTLDLFKERQKRVSCALVKGALLPGQDRKLPSLFCADRLLASWRPCARCKAELAREHVGGPYNHALMSCWHPHERDVLRANMKTLVCDHMRSGDSKAIISFARSVNCSPVAASARLLALRVFKRNILVSALAGLAFVDAAAAGHANVVHTSIDLLASIKSEIRVYIAANALKAASEQGHFDVVRALVRPRLCGAGWLLPSSTDDADVERDKNDAVQDTNTALESAVAALRKGHENIARWLLKRVPPENMSASAVALLGAAIEAGIESFVAELVARYPNDVLQAAPRLAALAASLGHLGCARFVLPREANDTSAYQTTAGDNDDGHEHNAHTSDKRRRTGSAPQKVGRRAARPAKRRRVPHGGTKPAPQRHRLSPSYLVDALAGGHIDAADWLADMFSIDWASVHLDKSLARAIDSAPESMADVARWVDGRVSVLRPNAIRETMRKRLDSWIMSELSGLVLSPLRIARMLTSCPWERWCYSTAHVFVSLCRRPNFCLLNTLDMHRAVPFDETNFLRAAVATGRVDLLDWLVGRRGALSICTLGRLYADHQFGLPVPLRTSDRSNAAARWFAERMHGTLPALVN